MGRNKIRYMNKAIENDPHRPLKQRYIYTMGCGASRTIICVPEDQVEKEITKICEKYNGKVIVVKGDN